MKIAVFNTKDFDKTYFEAANFDFSHQLVFFDTRLNLDTAILAKGFTAICCFVTDDLSESVLSKLQEYGVKVIALRSAGFNHVDLAAAKRFNLKIVRVPDYSPYAVAEHAVALILALNRKLCRAHQRVREANFSLHGLLGFDLHGCTVGIIGLGKIGQVFAKIMQGFGCKIYAYDPYAQIADSSLKIEQVDLSTLCQKSKIISLHCPLTSETKHIINEDLLACMQKGVMLINTGRGALIDTKAAINGLKSGKIGYLGLDVYEEENKVFFEDQSEKILQDDVLARLLTFPNVIVTGHQAFFTEQALTNIATTTLKNISAFEKDEILVNEVKLT